MTPTNATTPHPNTIRMMSRVALLVALAAAIIVGLLAMHSTTSMPAHASSASAGEHSALIVPPHPDAATTGVTPIADCAGCADDMSMSTMWCVLALLTTVLLLITPRGTRLGRQRRLPFLRGSLPGLPVRVRPHALSLTVLCISRT